MLTADKIKAAIVYFEGALLKNIDELAEDYCGGTRKVTARTNICTALAALRECEDRRLPMPLKPDELRVRIGKPIWIEYALPDGKKACCWAICDIYQDKLLVWKRGIRPWYARGLNPNCIDFDLKDYETFWLAYDHGPYQEHGVEEKERGQQ